MIGRVAILGISENFITAFGTDYLHNSKEWHYDDDYSDDFELMQFTGLTDKNGKDIYEGDIVSFHYFFLGGGEEGVWESEHELQGVMTWGLYGWAVDAIKGQHWQSYTGYDAGEGSGNIVDLQIMNESSIHSESFEVIGNVYENPELL